VRLEGLGQLKKIHLIGTRTCDLPACSIVPQPTTLLRAPYCSRNSLNTSILYLSILLHSLYPKRLYTTLSVNNSTIVPSHSPSTMQQLFLHTVLQQCNNCSFTQSFNNGTIVPSHSPSTMEQLLLHTVLQQCNNCSFTQSNNATNCTNSTTATFETLRVQSHM
jgi:hypothetical protein